MCVYQWTDGWAHLSLLSQSPVPSSILFQGFMVLYFAFDALFPLFLHTWSFDRSSSLSIVLSAYSLSTHVY